MKKKQITWIIAAALTIVGVLFLHKWFVDPSSWKGVLGLAVGCLLLYPSVKGWAELIEPKHEKDEKKA